jgi:hypothetical protein
VLLCRDGGLSRLGSSGELEFILCLSRNKYHYYYNSQHAIQKMPTNLQPYRVNDMRKSFEAYQFSDVRTPTESSYTYQASDAPQSPGSYSYQVEDTPQSPKAYSYQVNDMLQSTETYQWYIEFHGRK